MSRNIRIIQAMLNPAFYFEYLDGECHVFELTRLCGSLESTLVALLTTTGARQSTQSTGARETSKEGQEKAYEDNKRKLKGSSESKTDLTGEQGITDCSSQCGRIDAKIVCKHAAESLSGVAEVTASDAQGGWTFRCA